MPGTVLEHATTQQTLLNYRLAGPSFLDIASGQVDGFKLVNVSGETTNADSNVETDVWDGSDAGDITFISLTTPRQHNIASTSTNDAAAGSGARTVRIHGLPAWDSSESYEDVTLNGVVPVTTTGSYVIINKIERLTVGASGVNEGDISATAQVDGVMSALIRSGLGQTQTSCYGIPDGKAAMIIYYYASITRSAPETRAIVRMMVNEMPYTMDNAYKVEHANGIQIAGQSYIQHQFSVPKVIRGPAVIKLQITAGANNTTAYGGFGLVLRESQ